ncbi:terpene synthase [Fusarium sporotrichioides]|uniref:Terpene synthase n=1 Tax=Fusarium sporotrichioides TaxID=5514 RepID=A0A395RM51_FUSSP|nr:terpene synthase [Fusarium sporotrichioides]
MRRKRDDIAKLTCLWYPQARKREMEALALYTTWLVCWDDAVDANEGDLAGDFARAECWRRQTLGMVHEGLAVDGMCARGADGDPINDVFRDFGSRICETASRDQRRVLYDEIQLFTASCAAEQELRLASRVPDYESYMKLRIGTVGGRMLCSLVPYATQEGLPQAVLSSAEVHRLWTQVCVLLSLLNDLLSLKKELQTGCVINAVAAIMEPNMTLDMVVAELEARMRMAVSEFDDAASKLIEGMEVEGEMRFLVEKYVEGCRCIVTGTLEFTLTSPRYSISKLVQEDGSLKITL